MKLYPLKQRRGYRIALIVRYFSEQAATPSLRSSDSLVFRSSCRHAKYNWTTLPSEGVARNSKNPRGRRNDLALLFSPDLPLVRPGTIRETEQNDTKQKVRWRSRSRWYRVDRDKARPTRPLDLVPLVSRIGPPFCIYRAREQTLSYSPVCLRVLSNRNRFILQCNRVRIARDAIDPPSSIVSRRGQILEPRLASGVDWFRDWTRQGSICVLSAFRGRDGRFLRRIFFFFFFHFFQLSDVSIT